MPDKADASNVKTFYHLLGNTIVANITNNTVWFALIFYVYLQTRSATASSVTNGLYFVSLALSGFWFGSLVDRYPKKRVMLLSGLFPLLAYAVGFAFYLAAPAGAFQDPGGVRLWTLVPVLLIGVLVGNIRSIALPTVITLLFPEDRRDKANGLAGTAAGVAILVTSAISGFLVAQSGLYAVLILAMVVTVATTIHLYTLPIPEGKSVQAQSARVDIRGTLRLISGIPGLLALILFATFNNFLGGLFAGLMDPYGLTLVSVEVWGVIWAIVSVGFIVGGLIIARRGLGANPLRTLLAADAGMWTISIFFMIRPAIALLTVGTFLYLCLIPFIEAAEQTVIQKVVPQERQGRVFGFAQSVELAATPLTTFFSGPLAELVFIPLMTTGAGARLIGSWFGTGADRGIALIFMLSGIIGLLVTLLAMRSRAYRLLSERYIAE